MKPVERLDRRASILYLARWIAIAAVSGVTGPAVVQLFRLLAELLSQQAGQAMMHPVLTGAVAALLVGLVVYRISPDSSGEGVPSYLFYLNSKNCTFPLSATLMKFPAALLTIAGGGAGGLIGPLGRVNAGLLAWFARRLGSDARAEERARTAAICGMSATLAALFQAPLFAAVFAVEVIQRANMRYRDLFPSLLASGFAASFVTLAGWRPLIATEGVLPTLPINLLPAGIGFSLVVSVLSGLYVRGYAVTVHLFKRDRGAIWLKVLSGMVGTTILVALLNPAVGGTATDLTKDLLSGTNEFLRGQLPAATPVFWAALVMLLLRAAASLLTIGSGMSAGLAAPALQLGLLAAVGAAAALEPVSGVSLFPVFAVVGMSGMLAGAMNVPLAASLLAVELFGLSYGVAGSAAAIIAFQINRHATIYDHALAGAGHLEEAAAE